MPNSNITIVNNQAGVVVAGGTKQIIVNHGNIVTVNTGNVTALVSPFNCGEDILAYQVLAAFGSTVRPATVLDASHAENIVGLALTDCVAGGTVEVVTAGRVTFSGWTWDDTMPLYLDTVTGQMVQTAPGTIDGATFCIRLGVVRDPDSIDVNIGQPIFL